MSVYVITVNYASGSFENWGPTCAISDFRQCFTTVYEPCGLRSNFGQQKAKTVAAIAMSLMQLLLLIQMTYSSLSCEIEACCDALASEFDLPRNEALSVNIIIIYDSLVNF